MLLTGSGHHDTTARFVLVTLADAVRGKNAVAYLTITTIRFKTGFDYEVIRRALRRLAVSGLITDTGRRRGDAICWQLNMELARPETDRKAIEAEVDQRREKDRRRKSKRSTVLRWDSTTQDSGTSTALRRESTVLRLESTVLRQDSTTQDRIEPVRTNKEPVKELTPAASATAKKKSQDEPDPRFAEFWSVYPRREGKQHALKAYSKAITDVEPAVILNGARRYAAHRAGENPKYTKMPATWLNGGCWEDELPQRHAQTNQLSPRSQRVAEGAALAARYRAEEQAAKRTNGFAPIALPPGGTS